VNPPKHNNWYSWSYDDVAMSKRTSSSSVYKQHFNVPTTAYGSYYDELYNTAKLIRDTFSGHFDLLLSGGIDSEVIARLFKDLGITHNTLIFRFENGYNYRDVNSAIDICDCLNIPYKIIDLNIQDYIENDAWDLFKKTHVSRAARLVHFKFFDFCDNIPIMGEGEQHWYRKLKGDYSTKSEWHLNLGEEAHNNCMYLYNQGREAVTDFYEYTPELVKSLIDLPYMKQLFNDEIYGKEGNWSSRIPIHQQLWPDIKYKTKLVGLEGSSNAGVYPDFINKFQEEMSKQIDSTEFYYNVNEARELLKMEKL
jgi:hypothetical protein